MQFNLKKPLCFFDLEATGLNVVRDRIVQIAIVKFNPDGSEEEYNQLINPGIPMSEEAMNVHGITPQMLRNKPTFAQVAEEIHEFIGKADMAGYNSNNYDIPMLLEEFNRVGIDWDLENRHIIDAARIFYKMEPRTLAAALKFYAGKEIVNAHDALADVRATIDVLRGQLNHYAETDYTDANGNRTERPVANDMRKLHEFTNDSQHVDVTRRLKYDDKGRMVFNFGKYNGRLVEDVLRREPHYADWILNKDFSVQVKRAIEKVRDGMKKR